MSRPVKISLSGVIGLIVGGIIGLTIGLGGYRVIAQKWAQTAVTVLDKDLFATAESMNKMTPMMVDQYTRLDNGMAVPGQKTILYHYTFVNED